MPELPEVETIKRGIEPHVTGHKISQIVIRHAHLRWPVPTNLAQQLKGQTIDSVTRRGKYLLFSSKPGTVILHLGMSGSLRITPLDSKPQKHDHVDFIFDQGLILRFRDPRRFGSVLWTVSNPQSHSLLKHMGPEPLDNTFCGDYLFQKSRKRKAAIKNFIMNSGIVAGIGNIYANEALFRAGIHPQRSAGKTSLNRYQRLVTQIQIVLREAIEQGGTTLKDFVNEAGKSGYFQQKLHVYNRDGKPCLRCGKLIKLIRLGQRSTFFCYHCQR